MDVRPHPHINLATVTYLFEGAIDHRDSLGTVAAIDPGAVNLMTAGSGIVHSERCPQAERAGRAAALGHADLARFARRPGRDRSRLRPCRADGLPMVEDDGASARVIMGKLWGASAATPSIRPTIYADSSC